MRQPYCIIYSEKKNAIWKDIFRSFSEAKIELDTQLRHLPEDQKLLSDWHVEERNSQFDNNKPIL